MAHTEALAVNRRPRLATSRVPGDLVRHNRTARVEHDLSTEADDTKIRAQDERTVDGAEPGNDVRRTCQILLRDDSGVLEMG